jgi:hypothetical protein
VTAKSGHNAAGLRNLQKSGDSDNRILLSLFVKASSYITKSVTNVTICDDFVTR